MHTYIHIIHMYVCTLRCKCIRHTRHSFFISAKSEPLPKSCVFYVLSFNMSTFPTGNLVPLRLCKQEYEKICVFAKTHRFSCIRRSRTATQAGRPLRSFAFCYAAGRTTKEKVRLLCLTRNVHVTNSWPIVRVVRIGKITLVALNSSADDAFPETLRGVVDGGATDSTLTTVSSICRAS